MHTRRIGESLLGLALFAMLSTVQAQPAGGKIPDRGERGEMLYSNHCIACHTEQVHWREQGLARDWGSLNYQVQRWARNTGLQWEPGDVNAVAEYLNRKYYNFPSDQKPTTVGRSGK